MDCVVIRSPMIYGYGAPGNYSKLIKLLKYRIPLPFLLTKNKRSFVGISNLVSFIFAVIRQETKLNRVLYVSDGADLTTSDFICHVAASYGINANLFYFPESALRLILMIMGKNHVVEKLLDSFCIDATESIDALGWSPPYTIKEELANNL
jgi:nucleoside-diphosphate-sugar epimerase